MRRRHFLGLLVAVLSVGVAKAKHEPKEYGWLVRREHCYAAEMPADVRAELLSEARALLMQRTGDAVGRPFVIHDWLWLPSGHDGGPTAYGGLKVLT